MEARTSTLIWTVAALAGAGPAATSDDLTALTLEELMEIEVTLASRKPERLSETPAAVFVLTAEELRRSGVRTLPQALRLVPGMQVGQVDANKWAVTARGFPGLFANKLLVLIDGRSAYTPLFSGVFWEAHDVVLEDVERIEVIRGPGGALWGANAVNGVINVVTKAAGDTPGGFAQLGGGTGERGFGTVRAAGRLGQQTHYRVYARHFERAGSVGVGGVAPADAWHMSRGGGRVDWQLSDRDAVSVLGNVYAGSVGQAISVVTSPTSPYVQTLRGDAVVEGGDVLARWERSLDSGSHMALQVYADRSVREEQVLAGTIYNLDLDFQYRSRESRARELAWGLGYRLTADEFDGSFTMSLYPESRSTNLFSAFLQHDIALVPERLRLVAGAKLERNVFTGFEVQPNLRVWASPTPGHALWAAVSRAVRTPSRADHDIRAVARAVPPDSLLPGAPSPAALVVLMGNGSFESEDLLALDMGYRAQLGAAAAVDVAAFYNLYRDLRTNELDLDGRRLEEDPPHLIIPLRVDNRATGRTWGAELVADWRVRNPWRMRVTYSYLAVALDLQESTDAATLAAAREIPSHQVGLRSYLDLPGNWSVDANGRYVDAIRVADVRIDAYLTCGVHLGWRPHPRLTVALVGQNLLQSPHREYHAPSAGTVPAQVEAGLYGALNWEL